MADDELLARFLSPERTTLATDIADDSAALSSHYPTPLEAAEAITTRLHEDPQYSELNATAVLAISRFILEENIEMNPFLRQLFREEIEQRLKNDIEIDLKGRRRNKERPSSL